jgi:signal transduction histidine kinase
MRTRAGSRYLRFPPLLAAGAAGLTLLGLFGLANEVSAGRFREWERARGLVRLAAEGVGSELARLQAEITARAPDPVDPGAVEDLARLRPSVLLAFAVDPEGRLLHPEPPQEAEPAPADERARLETFLDEASFREFAREDLESARRALDRAREGVSHPSLAASADLARASFELRRGDTGAALERLAPWIEGPSDARTFRAGHSARSLARLLALRALRSAGEEENAREEARALLAALESEGAGAPLGFLAEIEDAGLLEEREIAAAREKIVAASLRRDFLEALRDRGSDLAEAEAPMRVGDALAVLGPRNPAGRAGVLLDPESFLAESLPAGPAASGGEGIPLVDPRQRPASFVEEVPGSGGALAVGLSAGYEPAEPGRARVLLLGALLTIFGGTIVLGAARLARATRREVEAARSKSEFLAGVTHELKTPLTSIRL